LRGHTKPVHALAFFPDGKTLASGGEDGSLRLWDWAAGTQAGSLPAGQHHVHGLAVAPDGSALVAAVSGAGLRRWALPSREELPAIDGAGMARAVSVAADGRTLATVHEDGTVKLFDTETGKQLATLKGHAKVVLAVAFAPDG